MANKYKYGTFYDDNSTPTSLDNYIFTEINSMLESSFSTDNSVTSGLASRLTKKIARNLLNRPRLYDPSKISDIDLISDYVLETNMLWHKYYTLNSSNAREIWLKLDSFASNETKNLQNNETDGSIIETNSAETGSPNIGTIINGDTTKNVDLANWSQSVDKSGTKTITTDYSKAYDFLLKNTPNELIKGLMAYNFWNKYLAPYFSNDEDEVEEIKEGLNSYDY